MPSTTAAASAFWASRSRVSRLSRLRISSMEAARRPISAEPTVATGVWRSPPPRRSAAWVSCVKGTATCRATKTEAIAASPPMTSASSESCRTRRPRASQGRRHGNLGLEIRDDAAVVPAERRHGRVDSEVLETAGLRAPHPAQDAHAGAAADRRPRRSRDWHRRAARLRRSARRAVSRNWRRSASWP